MKKFLFFAILLLAALVFIINCPDGPGGNGGTTPEGTDPPTAVPSDGPTPSPDTGTIVIDDFESVNVNDPPGGNWLSGVNTTYGGGDNEGVVVKTYLGPKALTLMNDQFGNPGSVGTGYTGYSYAQVTFDAPAAGTLNFDYYHSGWVNWPAPEGTLEFWLDLDIADIGNPSPPSGTLLWSHGPSDGAADDVPFVTQSETISSAGTYTLTWRIFKDWNEDEDDVSIDTIEFDY